MAIPAKQIGWGTEENLLWQISKQLESLTGVTYNSKKTLLNVASGENAGSKIETFSGAFTGVQGDVFFTINLNEVSGGIIEYYLYCPSFGDGSTGTFWFGGRFGEGKYINTSYPSELNTSYDIAAINTNQDGDLINFKIASGAGELVQMLYTVKLFTSSLYNA